MGFRFKTKTRFSLIEQGDRIIRLLRYELIYKTINLLPYRSISLFINLFIIFFTFLSGTYALEESPSPLVSSQNPSFNLIGIPVASVKYQCDGDFSLDEVSKVTVVKQGNPFSRSELRESIQNIYSLGGFSDIQVDAFLTANGVNLTFNLTTRIKVNNIEIIGNSQIDDNSILRIIRLRRGREYNESIVKSDVLNIQKAYISQGYVNVSITFSENINQKNKLADVKFYIVEGKRPVIADIRILGTTRDVVKDIVGIDEKLMKQTKIGGVYQGQRALDSDAKLIEDRYREKGYITAKVRRAFILWRPEDLEKYENQGISLKNKASSGLKEGEGVIFIQMEQGKKVYIKILVDGKEIKDKKIMSSISARKMGSISESVLRKSAEDIGNYYKSKGYYLAAVDKPLIMEDISWIFENDSDSKEWTSQESLIEVTDKILRVYSENKIPQIQSPKIDIDTNIYRIFLIRMRTSHGDRARLYWTEKYNNWNNNKYAEFPINSNNQFQTYQLDIPWKFNKNIQQVRLFLSNSPGAKVEITSIKLATNYTPIVFQVTKNRKMKIKKDIVFLNSNGEKTKIEPKQIRKQILTHKKHPLSFWPLNRFLSKGIFDDIVFQTDQRAIVAFYKDQGYTQATIDGIPEIKGDEKKGEISITVRINEGDRTVVKDVILKGNNEEIVKSEDIFPHLSVIEGFKPENIRREEPAKVIYNADSPKPFREDDIILDRSYLRLRYADKGYLAKIEPIREFRNNNTEVAITYDISPGKQIRIDKDIEINGNNRTKRHVIERELSDVLIKDNIFSYTEIAKSWQRLYDLGIFENVKIDPQPVVGYDDLYKLVIDLNETKKAISLNMHIGFSSTEEFRGGVELSHINIWGTNRKATMKALIGTEGTRGEANYIEPRLFGTKARGFVDLYRRSDRKYNETWTGGDTGLSQTFYRYNTITLRYRYDILEYAKGTTKIGRIETSFQRDTRRDNPLNPKSGWLHSTTLEYADQRLMGNENFTKFTMSNARFFPLPLNSVLALSALTGYAWGLDNTKRVLTPLQFDLTEYNTPRGYKWSKEDSGNIMLNLSGEFRFPIFKRIGGTIFFDSVLMGNKISDLNLQDMESSLGGGLRFVTPIGPARLDYGYPIHGNGKRNLWPQIAFGHAF